MEIALAALSIVVGLALFYTGLRRIELSNVAKSIVWFLDLAVLIAGIVLLGPLGAVVFAVGTVIAVLGWSIYLAAQKQTHLIYASTQAEAKKEEMYALHRRLWESHDRADPLRVHHRNGRAGYDDKEEDENDHIPKP